MNLRQLQYFKTIAELEHYTRAAEKLYVSQSNLSHSMAALEEELDNVALAMELWAAGGTAPQAAESCGCEAPRVNPADLTP